MTYAAGRRRAMIPRRGVAALGATEPATYLANSNDASRNAYLAWAAGVKQYGGRVTAYHYHGTTPVSAWFDVFSSHDTYGLPCASYPMAIAATFDTPPDQVASSATGDVAYYLAPPNVLRWAGSDEGIASLANLEATGNDQVPPENNNPVWYNNLKSGAKIVAIGGVALLALSLLSFIPHKDWE